MRALKRMLLILILGLPAIGALAYAFGSSTAASSVSVGGIPVGGLSSEEIADKLEPAARAIAKQPLVLRAGDQTFSRSPASLGLVPDLSNTIRAALHAGRENPIAWIRHMVDRHPINVAWVAGTDPQVFDASLLQLARQVDSESSNGQVRIVGIQVVVETPAEGLALRPKDLANVLLRSAFSPDLGPIALPVRHIRPKITAAEVESVKAQAEGLLSRPSRFVTGDRVIELPTSTIASALEASLVEDVETGPGAQSLVLQADAVVLHDSLVASAPGLEHPARDAAFQTDREKVVLMPSEDGTVIDAARMASDLIKGPGASHAPIPINLITIPAGFTTDAASSLGITKRISTFTTTFDAQNAPRVANIDKMSSAINGRILKPGESFSLNDATGPRTPENGYQEAKIIVDGELVPGIGGGVCQVATTVFNAVFNAGLQVDHRTNHSLHISHYPLGRDATVNYGHQDLAFTNDTPFGLLIRSTVTGKAMNVSLYSSDLGRTVETATSPQSDPTDPSVKYVDDPAMPAGQEVVDEPGSPGFKISVTRMVTSGGQVLHSDTFVSKYRPWKRIIRRGTGGSPAPSPSPTTH